MGELAPEQLCDCNKLLRLIIDHKMWKIKFYTCLYLLCLFSSFLLPKRAKLPMISFILLRIQKILLNASVLSLGTNYFAEVDRVI